MSAIRPGLVGEEEDLPRQGDDTDLRTPVEHRPLVRSERAIALLGVHDPRRHAGFAEASRGVVIAVQPAHVRLQSEAHVAGVVPRKSARSCS